MFWLSKKKQKELIELEQKVQRLRSEEQDLLASIRRLKEEQTRELTTAVEHFQFSLDFDRMDAFKNIMSICKDNGSILLTIWSYETVGARKPREFTKGDNIVMWNNREERFYYIFDKSDWIDFLELNKKIYNFEYKLLWE